MACMRIGVEEARELIDEQNAQVVDVRDRSAFEAGHIPGATFVDESGVQEFIANADSRRPLIVCCYHGNMSQGAADYFNRNGFEHTYSLDGGWEAWEARSR
jgi:thiosulfate sulfurtransferase